MDRLTDGQTEGRLKGRPNGPIDTPAYRDLRMHLERTEFLVTFDGNMKIQNYFAICYLLNFAFLKNENLKGSFVWF